MQMQIVMSAASLPEAGLSAVLDAAQTAGYNAVQLFRHRTEASLAHPQSSMRQIRESLTAAHIELASCEIRPLTGRKADTDERNLPYNLRQLEWDIHLCRALNARTLGLRGGDDTEEARQDLVEGINQLAERIDDVTLAVGTQAGSCLATAADIDALVPSFADDVGLMLDTAELLACGQDPVAIADSWGARLRLIYLHDVRAGESVGLGEGELDLTGLLKVLSKIDYSGPVVVETPADKIAAARQRLQS
ncbi:MAG TPA: hypothetical protein DIC52_24305 [Candidatus Latescibacteria bacterium]|nr:hypothetical protein [Candidatus Latescibacterota bacterium]|tara:strand:+ start:242 stop:988 length:747 start_codon:yes stop_codon:yes gene_type:complete